MAVLTIIFSFILLVLSILYFVIKRNNNYWKKRNVPHVEPTFLLGNFGKWILQQEYLGITLQKLCQKFPKEPYIGAFVATEPALIVQDPEILKLIVNKDFQHFSSREISEHVHKETMGKSLIFTYGEHWRYTRTNMTPMFTTSKLRSMFPLIQACADDFTKYLDDMIVGKPVEARKLVTSYTLAAFVSCAFGVDLKNYGQSSVFHTMGKHMWETNRKRALTSAVRSVWPRIYYALGYRNMPIELSNFFKELMKQVFAARGNKPSGRKDFIDSLLAWKESAEKQNITLDDDYMTAQCLAIFAGGFETSASSMSFLLFELAKHQEIQAKVHEEIDEYLKKTDGKVTYECLAELPYLNACMDESARLYPIIGHLTREVTKEYTMPTGLKLEKGLRIFLPVYHLHHNPEFFPKPEEFIPERFYGDTKQDIVPCSYMPFGEGARVCIGKRFGKLQSMTGIVTILRNHKVTLAEGMPTKLELSATNPTTMASTGINLNILLRH
ncbi:cytochrome p450 domain-containing protein [Phthorimaea operculella]|nr:cytochrome p450 domain-containing protein [Phthorimaea operculella]